MMMMINITYISNAITNIQTALNDDFTYNEDNNDDSLFTSIDESYDYFDIEDIEDSRGIYTTIISYTNQYIPVIRHDSCSIIRGPPEVFLINTNLRWKACVQPYFLRVDMICMIITEAVIQHS